MKSRKLWKENYRVQSKIFLFSTKFPFETKIRCFVTRLCTFAHSYLPTPDLLRKGPHIHVFSIIFIVILSMSSWTYFFVDITVVPVHFYYFIFCFKLYYPIVDFIFNHLYVLSLFKDKVMQIERALINDHLRVPKVSWRFRIPAIYNFAVIYPWNLMFP